MSPLQDAIPALSDTLTPPAIRGVADLTTFAYRGNGFDGLMDRIRPNPTEAGTLYDLGIALQLDFRRTEGLHLQEAALRHTPLFRLHRDAPVRTDTTAGAGRPRRSDGQHADRLPDEPPGCASRSAARSVRQGAAGRHPRP